MTREEAIEILQGKNVVSWETIMDVVIVAVKALLEETQAKNPRHLIALSQEECSKQTDIIRALCREEILSQCTEECCELGQACEKMRRLLHGTTPITEAAAKDKLNKEAGGVLLLLDFLGRIGYLDLDAALASARQKNERWNRRLMEYEDYLSKL